MNFDSESEIEYKREEINEFSHRVLENQQIGFKLAEEVRRLREELLKEKQEKRILLVSNQNLQAQLNLMDERMKKMELSELTTSTKLLTMEKDFEEAVRKHTVYFLVLMFSSSPSTSRF
jgi:uncharacterized coiled-coil protein SlyX